MAVGLLSLSPELHLRIIESLLTPKPTEQDDEEERLSYPYENDEQGRSKEHLVPEELKSVIKLSCTCKHMRSAVAPYVYKKLWLSNSTESYASVKAVAAGAFRNNVKEILFVGRAAGSEEDNFNEVDNVLPEETEDILANLSAYFPNLDTLNVGFAFEIYEYDKWDIWGYDAFMDVEDKDTALELEKTEGFRALTAKVWAAISRNEPGVVKSLKMRHFLPKVVSTYYSPEFEVFLSGVEKFHISFWGQDNGACWVSSTGDDYLDGISELRHILKGLESCLDLTFEASRYGWVGCEGMRHVPFPFPQKRVPLLKRLTLHHCIAGPELAGFLKSHKDTIEELVMQDCGASAASHSLAEDGIAWAELFSAMLELKVLRRFEVLPEQVPYSDKMQYPRLTPRDDEKGVEEVRNEIEASKGHRRVFAYGGLNDKYGDWIPDLEETRDRFLQGEDQKAWDALRKKIGSRFDKGVHKRPESM